MILGGDTVIQLRDKRQITNGVGGGRDRIEVVEEGHTLVKSAGIGVRNVERNA